MTPSAIRKALAPVALAVALFAAVVIQLTVVNRLPLPGATAPDLVLLLVTAIAVAASPAMAAITGFAGGLALDVAPPAAHYAGEYALVFCLAGYAAARVNRAIINTTGEHDPITAFTVMAVATAAGEAGKAALGMLLSDPDVTTAAVSRILPGAILYDLLLSPLAYWLVARVTRGAAPERAPVPELSRDQRLASVFRQASVGAAPNLRLAGTGMSFGPQSPARRIPSLRLAGTGENYRRQPVAGRVPKLRLSDARSSSASRTAAAFSGSSPFSSAAGRARKLNFGGDLPVRTGARSARTPGKNWLRSATSPALAVQKRSGRSPSQFKGTELTGARRAAPGAPIGARPTRSSAEALAARSAPSALSALSGVGTPLAGRRSPRAGWLRASRSAPAPAARRTPRRGWLSSSRRRPRTPGGNWHAASPSSAWLRRGRHPWRRRSQRLLRMMGVGK